MASTNLGLTQERATVAVRKDTVPPMMPVKGKKEIAIRTRRNGSSVRLAKVAEKEKEKGKVKEKQKREAAEIGRATVVNYLAPTITRETATASSATIVASLTTGRRGGSASIPLWPSKALPRNKRKQ